MLIQTYIKASNCLSFRQKVRFSIITFLNWFVQILEIIGIAVFLPVLAFVLGTNSNTVNDITKFIPENYQEILNINFFLILIVIIFLLKNMIFCLQVT